ncbi:MAG: tRNA (adenosine(37)-N6)-threonylcarbamoyltransferase complex dimerization subunit type 1 TsaB, partial [Sorangiineae bacterium]|nr:tRNA (adenosine(37)-N6)-threonylcarbamoyltransferase complex dimerization subunit type 1 TsaB [Sorangiineae bacterium]
MVEGLPAMRVLGIETSAAARGTVALAEGGVRLAEASHEVRSAHAELMLPLIARLLAEAGWARGSLDRLAVGVGPGSFTGVRVGIALAQGIALGLGVPVVGVPSLAAMARAAPPHVSGLRVPLLDARRGEVFFLQSVLRLLDGGMRFVEIFAKLLQVSL